VRLAQKGAPKQSLGRSRVGFTTKIHLRTNSSALPVTVELAPGLASDYTGALPLLGADGSEPKALIPDRGYDADWLSQTMEERSITPVIPTHRGRKIQVAVDKQIYALLNRIERCSNKLKNAPVSPPATTRLPKAISVSSKSYP
jgi:IS5 family transposase